MRGSCPATRVVSVRPDVPRDNTWESREQPGQRRAQQWGGDLGAAGDMQSLLPWLMLEDLQ